MNSILKFIESIRSNYELSDMPFLNRQLKRVKLEKPYTGLKILHNIPFTKETTFSCCLFLDFNFKLRL